MSPHDLTELIALRHELHRNPEVGFEVDATAAHLARLLEPEGFEITTGVGRSGMVASLRRGTSDAAIGLRAELDALPIQEGGEAPYRSRSPSRFHGCGHDGHAAMLVGGGRALSREGVFEGTVHLIFQPDEETGRGALAMIEDGLFDRFPVDAVFALHNLPGLEVGHFAFQSGPMAAFEEIFEIVISGLGGHASMPELTVDPVVIGSEIVLALQAIVSRSLPPREHGVVSVTEFLTDGARNIIPTTVTIRGDVRGFTEEASDTIEARLRQMAHGIAQAHGATVEVSYRREFWPVVNSDPETELAAGVAAGIEGARVDRAFGRVGFSEDFGQMLDRRPGCLALIGNGSSANLHSPMYDFNDDALAFGVDYWVRLTEKMLEPKNQPNAAT